MGDSDATDATYGFGSGIGEDEMTRLEVQGKMVAPPTRIIFTEAGIRPGMRVLDLGSGAGDTAFLAAELVGPGGSVVGVDHSPDALARARYRAAQRGLAQAQFIEGDIHDPAPGGPYDAIVERLTLWTVPDPAEVLRRQATVLRPGGLVVTASVDPDPTQTYAEPEMPMATQWLSWGYQAFTSIGSPLLTTGRRLWAIAEQAGLRPLGGIRVGMNYGPVDEDLIGLIVETLRNTMPLIVSTGVATAEEIDIETYEQRLRAEWEKTWAVIANGVMVGQWATTGPE
jgi:SAM-dependent methyltransferase